MGDKDASLLSRNGMNPRLHIVAGVVAALAFGAMVVGYFARGDDPAADTETSAGVIAEDTGFRGARIAGGVPAPDFELRDENGDPFTMRDLRGKPVVVTFLYSTCQDTCPATAQQIRGALDKLGHDVPAVAISVDPAGDDEASARRFLVEQRMTGRMRFALGSREQLAPLWKAYGTTPQTVREEHMARAVIVDAQGNQRVGFPMNQTSPEMIAHDLAVIERE
jgi:protein SCO1/2